MSASTPIFESLVVELGLPRPEEPAERKSQAVRANPENSRSAPCGDEVGQRGGVADVDVPDGNEEGGGPMPNSPWQLGADMRPDDAEVKPVSAGSLSEVSWFADPIDKADGSAWQIERNR